MIAFARPSRCRRPSGGSPIGPGSWWGCVLRKATRSAALVGTGAAYPALLAEALLSHALARGLPRQIAENAVRGVVVGASQLLGRDGMPPAEMLKTMFDYRGTTAAGLQAMIDGGFQQAVEAGLDAADAAAQRMQLRFAKPGQ